MKILVDDKIPYLRDVLEPFAEVVYCEGGLMTPEDARDADALITRTRTACNRQLLEGSKIRFIATATAGFDHIDIDYCRQAGIEWVNAPGCNAESVNQYMGSALLSLARQRPFDLRELTVGIVGVGQVGSRVARTCRLLGMDVLLNDPPRVRNEGTTGFVGLDEVAERSDIISFHVPLNLHGEDRTWHMVDAAFCEGLARRPILFNTCRGEVFDTGAIRASRQQGALTGLVIDCWEDEPVPDPGLLRLADYGTAHIAGYSRDGKAKGTLASVRALSRFFGLGIDEWEPGEVETPVQDVIDLQGEGRDELEIMGEAVLATYRITDDDEALRANPESFERLRFEYPARREYTAYTLRTHHVAPETLDKLLAMGFRCQG